MKSFTVEQTADSNISGRMQRMQTDVVVVVIVVVVFLCFF